MFNGFSKAKQRYNNSFFRHEKKEGIRHQLKTIWWITNIRIMLIYENKKHAKKILRLHNFLMILPKRMFWFPINLVLYPFRWTGRRLGSIWDYITKPMREKGDSSFLELDQVKRRYPHASLIECEKCESDLGFSLSESENKGWRYANYGGRWNRDNKSGRILTKITNMLVKLGIRWENTYYMTEDGELVDESCELDEGMTYVSSDGDCVFSLDGTEGDVCSGCISDVYYRGTRFKVYQDSERLTFNHYDGLVRPDDCTDINQYWDEIALHLGYTKQNEESPIKELKDLDITVDSGKNEEKYALIKIADELDVPLFAIGCSTLYLYCLPEHYQLFHQSHLEYMDNGKINVKALKKKFQKD